MPELSTSKSERRLTLQISAFLALVTLFLYWPASGYDFILADDYAYICLNSHVLNGLSWEGIKWAFWTFAVSSWHPLTWISHMMDCSLFGLFGGGHHVTNIFLHTTNTVLLFRLLRRLTGRMWPSAFVAALFAWHPLHVESVAWICERKDVLSTFFLLLTIGAYSRYVARPTRARFLLALLLFLFGLMAKTMLVTLPCLLLLLDYWPLNRLRDAAGQLKAPKDWALLIVEKIPFFVLSMFGCLMTVWAQSAGGSVKAMEEVSFLVRAVNATSSYGRYIGKAFWPSHLAVFYPLPSTFPWGLFAGSLLLIVLCTGLAIRWHSKFPWLIVGWCWFLGTLVPVIGLVQVGDQALADRYSYIPYIGLFLMVVWGVDYLMKRQHFIRLMACPVGFACLIGCVLVARHQLGYWRDSIDVFGHATKLTAPNKFSNGNLSYALGQAKHGPDAIPRYEAVFRLDSTSPKSDGSSIVFDADSIIRVSDSSIELSEALKYDPQSATVHNNLGIVLLEQHKPDEAIEQFEAAIKLNEKSPWAYFNDAIALQEMGRAREAINRYEQAIKLRPTWPAPQDRLAYLLATCPKAEGQDAARAVALASQANELNSSPGRLETLAIAYAEEGSFSNAVISLERAQQLAQAAGFHGMANSFEVRLTFYRAGKIYPMDWKKPLIEPRLGGTNGVLHPW